MISNNKPQEIQTKKSKPKVAKNPRNEPSPVRHKSGRDTILEPDLSTFSSTDRRKVSMGSQKEIPVNKKPSSGGFSRASRR